MLQQKRFLLGPVVILWLLLFSPLSAHAVGTLSLSYAGGATFNLVARGFGVIHGIDVTVSYDTSLLGPKPTVTPRELTTGAMYIDNNALPGQVRILLVSTNALKSSGTVATIAFEQLGSSVGNLGLQASIVDVNGKNVPVTLIGYSSGNTDTTATGGGGSTDTNTGTTTGTGTNTGTSTGTGGTSTGTGTTTTTTTTTGTGTSSPVVGGTVTLPGEESGMRKDNPATPTSQPTPQETRETPPTPVPVPGSSETASSPAPQEQAAQKKAKPAPPKQVQSVLEKFRLFSGEKTPQGLTALFEPEKGSSYTQTPAVALADGTGIVKVVITNVTGEQVPSFTFSHASYVSLAQTGEEEWQVEVRPEKGTLRASIGMLTEGGQWVLPLSVVPSVEIDLDKSGTVDEADFQLFLKNRGTDAAPKYDLNGDRKRDYQDDYIFTGNYLVKKGTKVKQQESAAPKKAQ